MITDSRMMQLVLIAIGVIVLVSVGVAGGFDSDLTLLAGFGALYLGFALGSL